MEKMEIAVSSANYDILNSGLVTTFEYDSNIFFKLNFTYLSFKFDLEFKFIDDDTNEYSIEKKIDENNKIILECKNFNNEFGIGTTKAIEIATIRNKKMYMNFSVRTLSNTQRILDYTFYIEK